MENLSDEKQRKQIGDFYRELWTYTGQVPWLVPVLWGIPCVICFWIPVNLKEAPMILLLEMFFAGSFFQAVLYPYMAINYKTQPQPQKQEIYRVLQYLPVSRKQIRRFFVELLWNVLWKVSFAALLGQILFSSLAGEFRISSILFVIFATLVLPMGLGVLMIFESTKEKK